MLLHGLSFLVQALGPRLAFFDPLVGELAGLDLLKDGFHFLPHPLVDDPRATGVVAVLGRVAHRVVHVLEAAFVVEVDDQLQLVQALEIGELGRISCLDEGLEAGLDEGLRASAEDGLFAKEVGFGLVLEGGFDHAGVGAADGIGIAEGEGQGIPGGILVYRGETGDATPVGVGAADEVPR